MKAINRILSILVLAAILCTCVGFTSPRVSAATENPAEPTAAPYTYSAEIPILIQFPKPMTLSSTAMEAGYCSVKLGTYSGYDNTQGLKYFRLGNSLYIYGYCWYRFDGRVARCNISAHIELKKSANPIGQKAQILVNNNTLFGESNANSSDFTLFANISGEVIKKSDLPFTDLNLYVNNIDISRNIDWFYAYKAYKNTPYQIISGTTPTTFAADKTCTRAEIAQMLWTAAGKPTVSGTIPFKDVKEGKWYYNAVRWAYKKGIIAGKSDDKFAPKSTCTRAEITQMVWRYVGSPNVGTSQSFSSSVFSGSISKDWFAFTDVTADKYYYAAVKWALMETPYMLTYGYQQLDAIYGSNSHFANWIAKYSPKSACTRAFACFLTISAKEYLAQN